MDKKLVTNSSENMLKKWGKSEISRCSNRLENSTFVKFLPSNGSFLCALCVWYEISYEKYFAKSRLSNARFIQAHTMLWLQARDENVKHMTNIWFYHVISKILKLYTLWNVIFRLPTFFSKVSKIFSIGHIAFIFSLRRIFLVILDSWKF